MSVLDKPILEQTVVKNFFTNVLDPVIQLIFAAAVFYFIWGVFKYIRSADDPAEREAGGKHIIYSVIGLFIMISVWGIISMIRTTFGIR